MIDLLAFFFMITKIGFLMGGMFYIFLAPKQDPLLACACILVAIYCQIEQTRLERYP